MFGYTVPLYSKLSLEDRITYRRYYCETCHQLRDGFGLISTAAVNYDMTFNAMVLSSLVGENQDFPGTEESALCAFGRPRSDSEMLRKMAAYTVILTKWELYDDKVDKPSIKNNAISLALNRAVTKAEKEYPQYDEIVGKGFEALRKMEEQNCNDAIQIGRAFGKELSVALSDFAGDKATPELTELFTSLTATIYLIDAVDDLDQDFKDDTFNPFLVGHRNDYVNKTDYVNKHGYTIAYGFNKTLIGVQSSYNAIHDKMGLCTGVLDNIVYSGLSASATGVLSGGNNAMGSIKNSFEERWKRLGSY